MRAPSKRDHTLVRRIRHRLRLLSLAGTRLTCPACGQSFRRFIDHRGRRNARCPACGAYERQRLAWAFIDRAVDLANVDRALHFAPEDQISARLGAAVGGTYTTVDIEPLYDAAADITALPFPDGAFDLVICCHVLEHVPDDRAAAHELARVLSPRGRAIVQVPQLLSMPTTDEDVSLGPEERAERYGQEDHLRIYGADFPTRLRSAGFDVVEVRGRDLAADADRWAVPDDQPLYDCTRRGPTPGGR